MNDMKTNQYWIKIQYGNKPIEVREIWADTPEIARIKAMKLAQSYLEIEIETPEETQEQITPCKAPQSNEIDQTLQLLAHAKDRLVVLSPFGADKEFMRVWHDINTIEIKILGLARKYNL
jgi:hypothetical protein